MRQIRCARTEGRKGEGLAATPARGEAGLPCIEAGLASEKEPMAGIHFKDFASTKGYLFLYRQLCRNPFKCPFLSSAEQKERGFMSIDWPMGHLTNNRLKQTKSNQVGEGILSFSSLFWKGLLGKQTIDIR